VDAVDTIKILGSLLGSGGLSKGTGGDVLGNILGSVLGGAQNQKTQGGDMLGNVLGNLLGGGQSGSSGGMGDLLGSLLGGAKGSQSSGGGLGDLLGSVLGGQSGGSQTGGNMGDLLGSLLGGGDAKSGSGLGGESGLGGLLGSALGKYAQVQNPDMPNPAPDETANLPEGLELEKAAEHATLIIRAMINAAKSDGHIDKEEQEKIIAKLGDLSESEIEFLRNEFSAPLDVEGFINSIPKEMQPQIYAVSLAAIDLDSNKEAQYLAALAQGFGFSPQFANELHERLGAPKIFNA
jgi:uncharacterized membrane protein YebE (DUF533 family)